jgi:hypothetical protein
MSVCSWSPSLQSQSDEYNPGVLMGALTQVRVLGGTVALAIWSVSAVCMEY